MKVAMPARWRRITAMLVFVPYGYALALVVLHLASAPSVAAWVRPSLGWTEAVLPLAAAIQAGHKAAGHPVYGMVNAHLLAVGHVSGLAVCVVLVAFGMRNTVPVLRVLRSTLAQGRYVAWTTWPLPVLVLGYAAFGLAILLVSVSGDGHLRPDGSFKGGRNAAALPGMALILAAQCAWLCLAFGTVLAAISINHGRYAMSEPEAEPPAGA